MSDDAPKYLIFRHVDEEDDPDSDELVMSPGKAKPGYQEDPR